MNNKKLVTTAKNLDTIAKICSGFMQAFGIVFAIFAVLVLLFGSKMFSGGSLSLDLDFVTLHLTDEFQTASNLMKVYTIIGLLIGSFLCFSAYYVLRLLRGILAPMKEGRPFEAAVPTSLKKTAWIVLIGGIVFQIAAAVESFILTKSYPMDQIFSSPAIAEIDYNYTIDFNFVWIFCILMFLSYIFSYGQQLQQESDETL